MKNLRSKMTADERYNFLLNQGLSESDVEHDDKGEYIMVRDEDTSEFIKYYLSNLN